MPGLRLAITMGDPAGIGPKIIARACARLRPRLEARSLSLLIIGSAAAMRGVAHLSGAIPEKFLGRRQRVVSARRDARGRSRA